MARGVLPGHFAGMASGWTDNGSMGNVRLRMGEVQAIYFPSDAKSVSKKYIEYDVWVQHRANHTAVTKMYTHVIATDSLGSAADFNFSTYRADSSASTNGPGKKAAPGFGAKVLLLCVNGETNNAVIIGGIRDFHSDPDDRVDGHHQHSQFNGIDVLINNDGELIVTYEGATKLDGMIRDDVDGDVVGTFIKIAKDGSLTLSDKNGYNSIIISPTGASVTVTADQEIDVNTKTIALNGTTEVDVTTPVVDIEASTSVTIASPQVALGQGEPEPPIKAVTFNAALTAFLTALTAYTTAIAPTADISRSATPALVAAIAAFAASAASAGALTVTVA